MFANERFTGFLQRLQTVENRELLESIINGFEAIFETVGNQYTNAGDSCSSLSDIPPSMGNVNSPQSRAMDTLTSSCEKDRGCDDESKKKKKKKLAGED